MKTQTLIVDTAHLCYRNLSKTGKDLYTSKTNLPVKSLYGMLTSLNKVLNDNPMIRKIYLCFEGYSNYRHELEPEYKSNREHNPSSPYYKSYIAKDAHGWSKKDSLAWTVNKIKEIAPTFAMHIASYKTLEGDDCAYVLGKQLSNTDELIFMSDDRDWQQLVNLFPGSKVYRAMADEWVTQDNFLSTQGIPANWFIYQKALLGDKSDNIKSVAEGCGDKAIEMLINKAIEQNIDPDDPNLFNHLQQIIKCLSDKNELGRYKPLIKFLEPEAEERYKLNIKLVDFRLCPVPLCLNESIDEHLSMDFDEALQVIRELEFKSLTKMITPGSRWYLLH